MCVYMFVCVRVFVCVSKQRGRGLQRLLWFNLELLQLLQQLILFLQLLQLVIL